MGTQLDHRRERKSQKNSIKKRKEIWHFQSCTFCFPPSPPSLSFSPPSPSPHAAGFMLLIVRLIICTITVECVTGTCYDWHFFLFSRSFHLLFFSSVVESETMSAFQHLSAATSLSLLHGYVWKLGLEGFPFQKKKRKRNVSSYAMTETMLELKEFRRWKKRKYFSFLSETLAKEAVVLVKALRSKQCVWTHKNVENCTNNCSLMFFSIRIRWCGNVYTSSTSSLKKSF